MTLFCPIPTQYQTNDSGFTPFRSSIHHFFPIIQPIPPRNYQRHNNSRCEDSFTDNTPSPSLVPLVTTFSHTQTQLHGLFKQNFSQMKEKHRPLQNYTIISALKKNPSLRDTLVKASFSLDSKVRTENQERLYSLKYIINPHSKCGAPIYQSLTLTSPNVVYAITCRQCDLLYVGETSKPLLTRLKQHLARISKGTPQTHLT